MFLCKIGDGKLIGMALDPIDRAVWTIWGLNGMRHALLNISDVGYLKFDRVTLNSTCNPLSRAP